MIRVTLKDGSVKEYDKCDIEVECVYFGRSLSHRIINIECFGDDIYDHFLEENIIKIEKQVKDLTLEECKKLKNFDTDFDRGWINKGDIAVEWYSLDDYIDITKLVVGE